MDEIADELSPDNELHQRINQEMLAIQCSDILVDAVENHIECIWKTIEKLKRQKKRPTVIVDTLVDNNIKNLTEIVLCLLFKHKEKLVTLAGPSSQNVRNFLSIVWVGTDSSARLCHQFVCSSIFVQNTSQLLDFLNNTTTSDVVQFVIKFILGCWHNCLRHVTSAAVIHFKEFKLADIIQNTIEKFNEQQMILAKGIIVLSYLLTDDQKNDKILENKVVGFIVQILKQASISEDGLSRRHGMSVLEVLRGIHNLSINDNNKEQIVTSGALPILVEIMKKRRETGEVLETLMIIWRLSFLNQIFSKIISEPDLINAIESLKFDTDERIRHSATGALWEIKQRNSKMPIPFGDCQPHVMISYQWDSQSTMLKVKESLKEAGFKVWMDVENISGSTLEAMSLAIENAAVVLIGMSKKYKESPNCRSEAEYAYKLRKSVVPLRLEPRYVPDGWLGIIVGTRLYFDFTSPRDYDHVMTNLLRELGSRGRLCDTVDSGRGTVRQDTSNKKSVDLDKQWTTEQLRTWLDSCHFTAANESLYALDSDLLSELRLLQSTSPDAFFSILRSDLLLRGIDILKFSNALRKLKDNFKTTSHFS